jgi:hypothetical protein
MGVGNCVFRISKCENLPEGYREIRKSGGGISGYGSIKEGDKELRNAKCELRKNKEVYQDIRGSGREFR